MQSTVPNHIHNYRKYYTKEITNPAQRKKLRGGVILQLFSRLSKFFIALLSRKRAAKLRVSELSHAHLHELSLCATSAALGIMQINLLSALVCTSFLRSFSSFAANNNSRSYSAVFRRLLLLWFFIARVIRRQRRNPAPLKIE